MSYWEWSQYDKQMIKYLEEQLELKEATIARQERKIARLTVSLKNARK